MSYTTSPTDLQIMVAIQAWVMAATGLDLDHVIQAHDNRVPEPLGGWAMLSHISRKVVATPSSNFGTVSGTETVTQGYDYTFQADLYGSTASDLALTLQSMFRSDLTTAFFEAYGPGLMIEPLYCEDATHNALVNEENQFEERWILRPHFNVAISVAASQQFMTTAAVGLINVETLPR